MNKKPIQSTIPIFCVTSKLEIKEPVSVVTCVGGVNNPRPPTTDGTCTYVKNKWINKNKQRETLQLVIEHLFVELSCRCGS
jgi:hypothetical protein